MDGPPLEVTKAYYASIMAQEELRLRARNARAARARGGSLEAPEQAQAANVRELLFRLVTADGRPPTESHPVRQLILHGPRGPLATVQPGGPMDNDPNDVAFLLTDPKFMLWREPEQTAEGFFRSFAATGGSYGHAPFVFHIRGEDWAAGGLELEIEHAAVPGDCVRIELLDGQVYRPIGTLAVNGPGWRRQRWPLAVPATQQSIEPATANADHEPPAVKVVDRWDTEQARFEEIIPVDLQGRPRQVFPCGEPFGFRIAVRVQRTLPTCWLVIVMYDSRGNLVLLFRHRFDRPIEAGPRSWTAIAPRPNLRQGEYLASVELLPAYDIMATEKLPFYCHWNRCVSLRVDEQYLGHIPLGLVQLPFEVREC